MSKSKNGSRGSKNFKGNGRQREAKDRGKGTIPRHRESRVLSTASKNHLIAHEDYTELCYTKKFTSNKPLL